MPHILTRIWEGKKECSEELYYEGQIFMANRTTKTVTPECESESEAAYYLNIVLFGLDKLGINPSQEES